MIRKSVRELNFLKSRVAMPSVEVQMEGLEAQGLHLGPIVSDALSKFAAKNPQISATIYSYGSPSFNFFNEPGFSEFLIVDGNKAVLKALGGAFASLRNVNSRFSDYIAPADGIATYHIEDGRLWEVEDMLTWYSRDPGPTDVVTVASDREVDEPDDSDEVDEEQVAAILCSFDDEELNEDTAVEQPSAVSSRRVGRAARADASVGTIRRSIEKLFGLPEGSVALCGPDGRSLRGDALIRTLRRRWDEA